MRHLSRLFLCLAATAALLLTSCGTMMSTASSRNYRVIAHKPHDPSKVEVRLSLATQNLFVVEPDKEGDRLLMAVQGNVGKPGAATPTGNFTIYNKEKHRRRQSEPDRGYPMAYWCEFAPAYGFHQGFVHPTPRTHGCIRLHGEAAPKFYALVRVGTPVSIAETQPEDASLGPKVQRVDDSRAADPDPHIMVSSAAFQKPSGPLLVE